jgi:hypothetical protein
MIAFNGCSGQTKESYIEDLNSYINSVDVNCKTYTTEDWVKSDTTVSQLIQIKDTKFNSDFTEAERSEVNQLLGKYTALRLKYEMGKIKGEFNDAVDQAKGVLKELSKDTI